MKYDYLIIGGGIAGTTAAETIRQRDAYGSIAIVSDEPHRLYSRLLLSKPNFFLGRLPFDQVWLKDEGWYNEQRVRIFAGKIAVRLDHSSKLVVLDDGVELRYGKLLLALGGCAQKWSLEGAYKQGVHHLRTLDDAKNIMQTLETARHGVAIGGGFVSFEMCDMMRTAGMDATVVLRGPYFWAGLLDEGSGKFIERVLEQGGVRIIRNTEVQEVIGKDAVEKLRLQNGEELPADLVVVGIGALYPFAWLAAAGVAVNEGIVTNEFLETNLSNIWAAGDAAEFNDIVLGEHIQLGNWVNAQMQGRRAGLNMVGEREIFRLVSFYTTQGFGMTVAFVGDVRSLADRTILLRGRLEDSSYARMFIVGNELVGAMLINRTQELGAISKLIERNINIASLTAQLQDPTVLLGALLSK